MPDKFGKLTRTEMEEIINRGESVIVNGQHISSLLGLPTAVDLAKASGDPESISATEDDLDAQIKALEEQKKQIAAAKKEAEIKAKDEAEAKANAEAEAANQKIAELEDQKKALADVKKEASSDEGAPAAKK